MVAYDNNNSIIADFEIFNESYIPSNILARSDQIKEIRHCLSPAYRNGRPINAWLYGPPGSGKTMISNFILEKLNEESKIGGVYINCWKSNSCYAALDTILNKLKIGFGDERDSRLKLYKFETFVFDALDDADRSVVMEICRSEEYSPVKNATGKYSPESARRDLCRRFAGWLEDAGIAVERTPAGDVAGWIEISPLFAADRETFIEKCPPGLVFDGELVLSGS